MASKPNHLDIAKAYRANAAEAQSFGYDAHFNGDIPRRDHGYRQAAYFNAAALAEAVIALVDVLTQATNTPDPKDH